MEVLFSPKLDDHQTPWYHAVWSYIMAAKRKKSPQLSGHRRRQIRLQQIIFAIIAFIVIASFVVSLIT